MRCTSSTTTHVPEGCASICCRNDSGRRVSARNVCVRGRSNQRASGRTLLSHVVFPVPRGPKTKKEWSGSRSDLVNTTSRLTVDLLVDNTNLPTYHTVFSHERPRSSSSFVTRDECCSSQETPSGSPSPWVRGATRSPKPKSCCTRPIFMVKSTLPRIGSVQRSLRAIRTNA